MLPTRWMASFVWLTRHSNEHEPTNIGNPDEFTMLGCAEKVLEVTASKSKIRFEPLPEDDPKQRSSRHYEGAHAARLGTESRPCERT